MYISHLLILFYFRELAPICRNLQKSGEKWGKILYTQGKRLSLHHHIKILSSGYNHIKVIGKDRQSHLTT